MIFIACLLAFLALLILTIITWLALDPERSQNGFDIE